MDESYKELRTSQSWSWDDLLQRRATQPEFVVEGIIPKRGVTLITGEGGIGKSLMLMELAYSVATGQPFLGHFPCQKGNVLYVDLENDETTIAHRVQKITTAHTQDTTQLPPSPCRGGAGGGVYANQSETPAISPSPTPGVRASTHSSSLIPHSFPTPTPWGEQIPNEIVCVQRTAKLPVFFLKKPDLASASLYLNDEDSKKLFIYTLNIHTPVLVLLDPLTAAHSLDENDNVSMRRMISYMQRVAREFQAAVVIVHHPRKRGMINDPGQMIRGASDLRNAVDSHLFLRRVSSRQIRVEHDKSRNSPEMDTFRIEIKDNEEATATYVRYVENVKQGTSKYALAKEAITVLLRENGPCRTADILDQLRKDDVSETTARRAILALVKSTQIIHLEKGTYSLPE